MKIIRAIDSILDTFEKWACVVLLVCMCALILIQIVLRIISYPLSWTEELARYMFVWCIYIGTGHAARFDKHLKVDILNIFLKGKGKFIFELLSNIATILFFIVLAMIMVNVLQFFTLRVQTSAALKLNMIYVYSAPFVCSLLSTLRYIENIARLTLGFKASKGNGNAREAS